MSVLLFALDGLGELARAEVDGVARAGLACAKRTVEVVVATAHDAGVEAFWVARDLAETVAGVTVVGALVMFDTACDAPRDVASLLARLDRRPDA